MARRLVITGYVAHRPGLNGGHCNGFYTGYDTPSKFFAALPSTLADDDKRFSPRPADFET